MAQTASELVRSGRDAMGKNDWSLAYDLLREAASNGGLDPDALEDLALSAWWSGRPDECIDAREQAYAGYVNGGQPKKAALVATNSLPPWAMAGSEGGSGFSPTSRMQSSMDGLLACKQ